MRFSSIHQPFLKHRRPGYGKIQSSAGGQAERMKGVNNMASYTIEDIELIRRKSGISYQEAVALLD